MPACVALLMMPMPVAAQTSPPQDDPSISSILPETRPGETARSVAGQTGQRQTREQVAQDIGIEPMARVNSRIQNRVQSRIRNRMDRYYDPQANTTSPFAVASDQARAANRGRRR